MCCVGWSLRFCAIEASQKPFSFGRKGEKSGFSAHNASRLTADLFSFKSSLNTPTVDCLHCPVRRYTFLFLFFFGLHLRDGVQKRVQNLKKSPFAGIEAQNQRAFARLEGGGSNRFGQLEGNFSRLLFSCLFTLFLAWLGYKFLVGFLAFLFFLKGKGGRGGGGVIFRVYFLFSLPFSPPFYSASFVSGALGKSSFKSSHDAIIIGTN